MAKVAFEGLSEKEKEMLKAARKVLERSYAPYSNFYVGAAVLTRDGNIITGTNYESASYGNSICAERSALLRANNQGHGDKCVAIAVVAKNRDSPTADITAPCGSCRQLIFEAAQRSGEGKNFKIIMATTNFEKIEVSTIGRLLPMAFGPDDLELEKPSKGKESEDVESREVK